jgi:hypothetical protein
LTLISTTNNTELMMTYYDSVFLERFKEVLVLDNWTDKKNIPLWRGKTVNYFSYYPLAGTSTAITEGASTANEATIAGQTIEATIAKYAQWAPYTERLKLTSRDKNLVGAVELFGEAAGKSLEEILAEELFQNGSIPIRVDDLVNSTTYTIEGRAETSAAHSSTTVFHDSALTQTSAFWDGAHVAGIYKATTNYRYGGIVDSHDSTDDLITMTKAAPSTFNNGFYYRMVVGTGITAANKMTGTAINYAVSKARENKFYTFPGGWFMSSLASQIEYDLQGDAVWRNIGQYQDKSMLEQGMINRLWGVEFHRATKPYRESVAGVKDMDGGVVFCTPIMGRHALGNVGLGGMRGHKIRFKIPGLQTTNEPYDERGTIGYKFYAAPKALNAAFCINLMSGASGVS